MTAIIFPTSTSPGDRFSEHGGRLINAYAEPLGPAARTKAVIKRAPGLSLFKDTTEATPRGMILVGSDLFAAFDDTLVKIISDGTLATVDALSGTSPVFFARNNKTPTPDIVGVTGSSAYSITTSSVSSFADPDLPSPNSCTSLLGFILFTTGDGRCFSTGLNAVTVDANHYIRAEANPDGLTRGIGWRGELWLFGDQTIEVWGLPINDEGFPFNRITIIPKGLAGARAIAGHEDGFSEGLIFVSSDNSVHSIEGYGTRQISPPQLDRLIAGVTDKTTLNACVYKIAGNAFWQINGPTFSWVYNITNGTWHERRTYLKTYSDIIYSAYAFSEWVVCDNASGKMNYVREGVYTEGSSPLVWRVESGNMAAFPSRFVTPAAYFDFVPGVGEAEGLDPIETDPQVAVSWSDDGGATFGNPLWRDLGEQGLYQQRIGVHRTGASGRQGRIWALEVSSPVYVGLLGGDMQSVQRAA